MIQARELFARRFWVWAVPVALVAINLALIALYMAAFAGDAKVMRRNVERQAELLDELRTQRQRVELFLESTQAQQEASGILYVDHFATESERFTRALREVRQLANRAGLNPSAFAYPSKVVDDQGLVSRGINFSVEGTYDQLRTFINLLEITDQFIALEAVNLAGGAAERNPTLKIRLSLLTYFVEDLELMDRDDTSLSSDVYPDDPDAESGSSGEARNEGLGDGPDSVETYSPQSSSGEEMIGEEER